MDAIAKHDIEYVNDKGATVQAKAKQVLTDMPKTEFDKLFALKAVVRADKEVVEESAEQRNAAGLTDAAPAGGVVAAAESPNAEAGPAPAASKRK